MEEEASAALYVGEAAPPPDLALAIDDADADDLLRRDDALPATLPSVPGAHPPSSMSAVYRFYEVEATLSLKRREESSIAKCRLCKEEGRVERKGCVRFSKSVTSNLWRHLKENHPAVYEKHAGEKKTIQMHKLVGKRGRKKKHASEDGERFLDEDAATRADSTPRKTTKRARRTAPVGDQFFTDYALSMSGAHAQHALAALHADKRPANLDRVREAAAYMCVHELVPFELCASLALRNLLSECHVGSALTEDASVLASVFGKQAISHQSQKLIEGVKERVATQLVSVDAVHLQIAEWAPATFSGETTRTHFVGVFAVALDQEFNPVRRCVCAVPIESATESVSNQLERSGAFKRALKLLVPHKHVPGLVVVEPSGRKRLADVFVNNKLDVLESITSLLRDIMVSTITGTSFTHPFMVGCEFSTEEVSHEAFERNFDTARFIEPTEPNDTPLTDLLDAEIPSAILTELPSVLTGHTIRDILLKILHLVAHIKHSKITRSVMRNVVMNDFHWDQDAFTQIFEKGPGMTTVGVQSIYEVLTLTLKMMPILQRYFELHKDGTSDLSKLMQLATLSTYEWERVGHLSSLLKPFSEAVAKLHEERFVTSSLIIPSVFTLLEKLRSPSDADNELPEDMVALRNVAYAKLSATFGYLFVEPSDEWSQQQRSSFNWLWSATLLDPRTRPFIIKGALPQAQFWEIVKTEASEVVGMNKDKDKDSGLGDLPDHPITLGEDGHDANGSINGSGINGSGNEVATGDLWDDLQANLASCAQEEMELASSKSALELTKSNNLLEVEMSFLQDESRISLKSNPLDWWQSMRVKYPYAARLARYVLSIPGSPAIEENPVLSDSGLLGRLLSQMSANDASELVTASMNLRLEKHVQLEATTRQLWSTV